MDPPNTTTAPADGGASRGPSSGASQSPTLEHARSPPSPSPTTLSLAEPSTPSGQAGLQRLGLTNPQPHRPDALLETSTIPFHDGLPAALSSTSGVESTNSENSTLRRSSSR
ncbi:hypothetical protein DL93DRAFT_2163149, partial [Clavulina sp. PMI_390]